MKTGTFIYNDEEYNFNFRTSLSAYEKLVFTKIVVDSLVNDDSYNVVIRDLMFNFAVIEMFTNVDTSFIDVKDDDGNYVNQIIIIEHFLESSNIIDIIKANVDNELFDELNHSIDLNVQYLTGININPISKSFANLMSIFEKKINEVDLNSMMEMAQKFSGMTEDFTMENIINTYMNSDIHKKNLEDIKEAKKK